MTDYLEKAVREGRLEDVRCPDTEWRARIALQDVRGLVSTVTFNM